MNFILYFSIGVIIFWVFYIIYGEMPNLETIMFSILLWPLLILYSIGIIMFELIHIIKNKRNT